MCLWRKVVGFNKCVVFFFSCLKTAGATYSCHSLPLRLSACLALKIQGTFCTIVKEGIFAWRKKCGIKQIVCSAAVLILQWLFALRLIRPQLCHHTSSAAWWAGGRNGLPGKWTCVFTESVWSISVKVEKPWTVVVSLILMELENPIKKRILHWFRCFHFSHHADGKVHHAKDASGSLIMLDLHHWK